MFGDKIAAPRFLLGDEMSALDIYVAMISRWRPGRKCIEANCPKVMGAVRLTEQDRLISKVWARNF